jgi:hypothetical protein
VIEYSRCKHICLVGNSAAVVHLLSDPHGEEPRSGVSNYKARLVASSFETRLVPLLRMRVEIGERRKNAQRRRT